MTTIIVPVKRLIHSKARMAHLLSVQERKILVLRMLNDVLGVLKQVHDVQVCVIGVDDEVKSMARRFNFTFFGEKAEAGLNEAISTCLASLSLKKEDTALVLPADIPLIKVEDVTSILHLKGEFDVVVCPSKDLTGTNALLLRLPPAIQPMFGIDSFKKHVEASSSRNLRIKILRIDSIARDVDSVTDLESVLEVSRETNTSRFIHDAGILERLR